MTHTLDTLTTLPPAAALRDLLAAAEYRTLTAVVEQYRERELWQEELPEVFNAV